MAAQTTVAACLMVRDEADLLYACLSSLEGQVDAIYVTDTGSRDESVAVANSFGAVVRFFQWNDNFAAARNASIEAVEEDWILTLDADDVFPSGEAAKIRRQLEPESCVATVRYSVVPHYTPVRAIKLFRNRLGARYEGTIHENVYGWLASRRKEGWRSVDLDVTLIHTGYTPDAMPGKVRRNLRLLEAEWDRAGEGTLTERRCFIGAELGLALVHAGRKDEGREFLRKLFNEAVAGRGAEPGVSGLQTLINLLWMLTEAGQISSALETVRSAESYFAASPVYQLHRGLTELAAAKHTTARIWLTRFRESWGKSEFEIPIPVEYLGAGWWRAMALCYMGEQDFQRAAECFEECTALEPSNREHQLRLTVARSMMK